MKNCQTEIQSSEEKRKRERSAYNLKSITFLLGLMSNTQITNSNKEKSSENSSEFKQICNLMSQSFLEIWGEDNDPSLQYFPSIQPFTDYKIIMQQMRRKKVSGLLFLSCLINLINLLLPESSPKQYQIQKMEYKDYESINLQVTREYAESYSSINYSRYIINLIIACSIFCFSIYVVFCSHINFSGTQKGIYRLFVSLIAQYITAFMFVLFPQTFSYQFFVNMVLLFTMLVKEGFSSRIHTIILLGNTFLVNYLAIEMFSFFQMEQQQADGHIMIQKLNNSLVKRLVEKINSLQQSLDIKDTYNASMIHELRNPLNAILGAIGLLKYSRSLSKEDHETLNIANMSGEILITLINNALDGAKIEANKLELDAHRNDIVETLTKSASLFQWKAKEKNVNISLKIGKKIPNLVEIDEARITQILVNIIGNAVKFTPENGRIKVRARFIPEDSNLMIRRSSQMKSSSSYIEDEEYEEKFFDNKELLQDMGQNSEELGEDDQRSNFKFTQNGSHTPIDCELDSFTDKSVEPLTSIQQLLNPQNQGRLNFKHESFTSLSNIESIDERQIRSKNHISEREMGFRNSFHEWSAYQVAGSPGDVFKQTALNQIQSSDRSVQNALSSVEHCSGAVNHIQNQNQRNSADSSLNEALNNSLRYKLLKSQFKNQQPHSGNVTRDLSTVSLDSIHADDQSSQQLTLTSQQTNSNKHLQRRKTPTKSKFYQQNEINGQEDDSEQEEFKQSLQQQFNQQYSRQVSSQKKFSFVNIDQLDASQNFQNENNLVKSEQLHLNLKQIDQNETNIIQVVKGNLVIEVIDSGIGISQEGIKKLFQPFQQAEKSIQAKYGGTGLGLWITNKLISLMRGNIDVKSELNKGTTFSMTIPVVGEYNDRHDSSTKGNQPIVRVDEASSGSLTPNKQIQAQPMIRQMNTVKSDSQSEISVLLLQDDEIMKKLFKKYLQKQQIQYMFAKNFKDLIRLFKHQKYDACFIDIDVSVSVEDLESLVNHTLGLKPNSNNYFCKIYSLFSRDIDKSKSKYLQRNNIKCIKKPIQGYQINKILRRIKTNNVSYIQRAKSNVGMENQFYIDDISQKTPSVQRCSQKQKTQPIQKTQRQISIQREIMPALREVDSMFTLNRRMSSSEHKVQDESPDKRVNSGQNKYQELGFLNFQRQQSRGESSNTQVNKQPGFSSQQRSGHQPRGTNSSSMNSSIQNFYNQNIVPKINQNIQRIRRQELHDSSNTIVSDSPRCLDMNKNQNIIRKNSAAFETLMIKNMKLVESPHFKETYKSNHTNSDEEEKKSFSQNTNILTPHFNNQSLYSPSFIGASDIISIKRDADGEIFQESSDNNHSSKRAKMSSRLSREPEKLSRTLPSGAVAAPQVLSNPSQFKRKSDEIIENIKFNSSNVEVKSGFRAVMVVDDNKMNQFIVQKMLEKVPEISKKKVQILTADNGEEAFQKYQQQFEDKTIALILMDCEMPILDGYEAAKKIRELENSNKPADSIVSNNCVIVGLSGNSGEQHSRKCKQAGMNEAITKPIVFDQLHNIVKQALDPKTKSQQINPIGGLKKVTLTMSNNQNGGQSQRLYSQSVNISNVSKQEKQFVDQNNKAVNHKSQQ